MFMLSAFAGMAQAANVMFKPGEVIVQFKTSASVSTVNQVKGNIGLTAIHVLKLIRAEHLRLPQGMTVQQAIRRLKASGSVTYAEPNYQLTANVIPNDTSFSQLWGMNNTGQTGGTPNADINAPEAWNIFTGNPNLVIADIDTGVDYNHPDLVGNIWTNPGEIPANGIDDDGNGYIDDVHGYDFVNLDGDPMDDNGHGTHTSGIIAARGNNALGVTGVVWQGKIMALKFMNAVGSGWTSDAVLAVQYAAAQGVRVSNNSWGSGNFSQALNDAIAASGSVFVAAAGNSGKDNDLLPSYPAGYPLANIIAVTATDHNDVLAPSSNYGVTSVDIAAPGVGILSTTGGGYASWNGTSMATAHVTGVVALLMGYQPALSNAQVVAQVLAGADAKGLPVATGGRLNAFNALNGVAPPLPSYSLQFNVFSDCLNLWFDPLDGVAHGNLPVYGPGTVFSGLYDGANAMGVGFSVAGSDYAYRFTVNTRSVDIYAIDPVGSSKTLIRTDTWSVAPSCPGIMSSGTGNTSIK